MAKKKLAKPRQRRTRKLAFTIHGDGSGRIHGFGHRNTKFQSMQIDFVPQLVQTLGGMVHTGVHEITIRCMVRR